MKEKIAASFPATVRLSKLLMVRERAIDRTNRKRVAEEMFFAGYGKQKRETIDTSGKTFDGTGKLPFSLSKRR